MTLAPNGLDEFEGRRATPEQHLTVSDSLRATGQNAVATGDLPLASEAYWGVVAHVFQAVAERHGIGTQPIAISKSLGIGWWTRPETRC